MNDIVIGTTTGILTRGKYRGTMIIGSDIKQADEDKIWIVIEHEQLHLSLPKKASDKLDNIATQILIENF